MKKLVKVEEVSGEGLIGLLGKNVLLFCLNYIYTGKLVGVNDTFILLENGKIVYETGAFSDPQFKVAQQVSESLYIQTCSIESYSQTNKSWLWGVA